MLNNRVLSAEHWKLANTAAQLVCCFGICEAKMAWSLKQGVLNITSRKQAIASILRIFDTDV